jgi:hypothetical protein
VTFGFVFGCSRFTTPISIWPFANSGIGHFPQTRSAMMKHGSENNVTRHNFPAENCDKNIGRLLRYDVCMFNHLLESCLKQQRVTQKYDYIDAFMF